MACSLCAGVRAFALNVALLADLALNTALGGFPRETVSKRTARARAAGSVAATIFCGILSWIGNVVFRAGRDHCTWADSGQQSIASEIWHWSLPDTSDQGNG